VIGLALRTLVRYVVPLAMLSVLVCAPLLAIAFRSPWPHNLPAANLALGRAFAIAGTAWMVTLVLVAAAAPLARSVAAGAPLSQPRALVAAFASTVRMALPCLAAIAAVVVGGLALVVPALALLVLLSLTGASESRGMPAPLTDSVAAVRARWRPIAAIIAIMLVVDIALAFAAWKLFTVPFAKKLTPAQWATYGNVARVVALGVLATAPVFATLLAAARTKR
jgi:hypothetical protein